MEGLSFDNILTDNDINNLFVEENDTLKIINKKIVSLTHLLR